MSKQKQNGSQPANGHVSLTEFPQPSYEEWREVVEAQLKGAPFEKKVMTKTYEGITLLPLYRQEDAEDVPYTDSLPGFAPYLRGSQAAGYKAEPWLISQELPYSSAEEFNQALMHDLERGQTAVSLRLDKAALLGQDPDEANAGDVGQGGLSVATIEDLATALEGVDLESTPIFLQASSAALPNTALLMALIRRQGKAAEKLRGAIEMDPLGALAESGHFPRSMAGAYDRMAQLLLWAKDHAPNLDVVTVHGLPYANSGSSAVQELAFTLATAVEYIREMVARGIAIDDVAQRVRFAFGLGSNYFMEVAKLRAARVLWAKVVKAFGGNEEAQKMTLHARTVGYNKTLYDPHVNMLRVTTEAFAGAAGGADSMHVSPFDEVLRQPDQFSRRIARNTQIILQQEAHLTQVIDPAGGSWYVEKLTNELARNAWGLFQEVEKQGGMFKALEAGFPQEQVAEVAEQRLKNLAIRKDVVVGSNRYANIDEKPLEVQKPDYQALHIKRAKYVGDYRTALDDAQATEVLNKLAKMLEANTSDVFEAAIEAATAGATLGEIARTLRKGDEAEISVTPLCIHRGVEQFEYLRSQAEAYQAKTGHRPQVFLANMGPIPQHKPRADFSTDFFQTGGFQVLTNNGFASVDEAAQAALDSGAPAVVICSTDADYTEVVPPLAKKLKAAKPELTLILAGYPKDMIDTYSAAGVDEFIHVRANAQEILSNLQEKIIG